MDKLELTIKEIEAKKKKVKEDSETIVRYEEKKQGYVNGLKQDYEELEAMGLDPKLLDEEITKVQQMMAEEENELNKLIEELSNI